MTEPGEHRGNPRDDPGGAMLDMSEPIGAPAPAPFQERLANWAWLLPALGAALIMTPVIRIFAVDVRLFGAPLIMIYVFGVWAALILIAARLASLDARADRDP